MYQHRLRGIPYQTVGARLQYGAVFECTAHEFVERVEKDCIENGLDEVRIVRFVDDNSAYIVNTSGHPVRTI